MDIGGKIIPSKRSDGAEPKKYVKVKSFFIDIDCVTNHQFEDFVQSTSYKTEAELYGWSFVLESLASAETVAEVDGPGGFGRVKTARHWLAVAGADWRHPHGLDISSSPADHPVVQVSHRDASEYCSWAGRRLSTEREWEYAARGGLQNSTYPWGDSFRAGRMNIWEGDGFPHTDRRLDGYSGTAPVQSYAPNGYGVYNTVGNVWEWVSGGTDEQRVLRGGSFIDSVNGRFNHAAMVSTRQTNSGDSAASNNGFRCAGNDNSAKSHKSSKVHRQDEL